VFPRIGTAGSSPHAIFYRNEQPKDASSCAIVDDRRMSTLQVISFVALGLFGVIVLAVVVSVIVFAFTGSKYVESKQDTKDE
jgi:hypothetical protein